MNKATAKFETVSCNGADVCLDSATVSLLAHLVPQILCGKILPIHFNLAIYAWHHRPAKD